MALMKHITSMHSYSDSMGTFLLKTSPLFGTALYKINFTYLKKKVELHQCVSNISKKCTNNIFCKKEVLDTITLPILG